MNAEMAGWQALPWNASQSSPRVVRAALATSFSGATTAARKVYMDDWMAESKTMLEIPRHVAPRSSFTVLTALAENLAHLDDSTFAVAERAVETAAAAAVEPGTVVAAADSWWGRYWNRSKVTLLSRPLLQRIWAGANYALGCTPPTKRRLD